MVTIDLSRAVIGHRRAVAVLERAIESDRLSHAYLFVGEPRIGKTTLALALARALNCTSEKRPCGVCRPCRLADANAHPDVQLIQAGGGEATRSSRHGSEKSAPRSISIDQVRALQHDAALAPVEGRRKIYIVVDAPAMLHDAANSLLKTLEEPPSLVTLILTATEPDALLPTIVSRCQLVRLSPVPTSDLATALAERLGATPERASLAASLAAGRPGWAISALGDESLLDERARRLNDLAILISGTRVERFVYAEKLAQEHTREPDRVAQTLDLWLGYWRDVRMAGLGCDELVVNRDRIDDIRARSRGLEPRQVDGALASVESAMIHLSQNVNVRLALDVMLLGLPAA
jgi:DNA polymerase III subunit delta'